MQMGNLRIHSSALSCISAAELKQGLSLLPRLKYVRKIVSAAVGRCRSGARSWGTYTATPASQSDHHAATVLIGPQSAPDGLTTFAQRASEPPHIKRADSNFNLRAMPVHSKKDSISNKCYHCTPVCPSTARFIASSPAGPCRKRGAIIVCASWAGYPTRLCLQILLPIKVYRMRGLVRVFGGAVAAQCRLE